LFENDLSESDLEVVQTTSRRQESACPGAADERKAQPAFNELEPQLGAARERRKNVI
jgi:hypothetical protein